MKLKKIIENLSGIKKIEGKPSVEIKGLASDSKAIKDGYLFAAIKGSRLNGNDFINEAIDRGAGAVLLESGNDGIFKRNTVFIYVEDSRNALNQIAKTFYGNISEKMYLAGVTGTNGKTTITYLLESLFEVKEQKTGVIGTINYRFGNRLIPSINTTPGVLELYSLLSGARKEGIENCVLEVSSHSLEQGRVDGLNFDAAIFTNLTSEHLDYHKNMENYFCSKLKLFTKIKAGGYAVINEDDPYGKRIAEKVKREGKANIITYGVKQSADVRAENIKYSCGGLDFRLGIGTNKDSIDISSRLIGGHNIYNILAAAAFGMTVGMALKDIKSGIERVSILPGRLERIDCGQDFVVFVDYAHTANGMENVLTSLRNLEPSRLLTVFGCGGDRDKSKRPEMGKLCSRLSDRIFITSDNPRTEDPLEIINEIVKGIDKDKSNYVVEADRVEAIKRALGEAGKGDIVLIAGKGHETYQIFKNVTLPFDDREVVRKILKECES
jgi:UDP-N-acetylmuramoyl-L-alanyl-D-glutamate--2,6-diaminopimelate ligase